MLARRDSEGYRPRWRVGLTPQEVSWRSFRSVSMHPLRQVLNRLHQRLARLPEGAPGDGELIARFVRDRDTAAFEALLLRHGPMIWSLCRRMVPESHAAEDCFQATWLVFLRRAASIRRPERLGNWLYGVAHKVAARAQAERFRRRTRDLEGKELPARDAGDAPARRELGRVLHEELGRLPARCRTALVLCYLEGRTQQEAADVLGWTPGTVRGQLERGRRRLRARLGRRGITLSAGAVAALLAEDAQSAVVPAVLTRTTVRAAVLFLLHDRDALAAASATAISLADGVCHMMRIASWNTLAALLIGIGILGGGVGWLAHRQTDAVQAAPPADRPVAVDPTREPLQAKGLGRAGEQPRARKEARDEAEKQEAKLQALELNEAEELLQARRDLLTWEEKLRALERNQEAERKRENAELATANIRVKAAREQVQQAQAQLDRFRAHAAGQGANGFQRTLDADTKEFQAAVAAVHEFKQRFAKQDSQRTEEMIRTRLSLLAAQDRVKNVERRQERERGRLLADIDAAQERMREDRRDRDDGGTRLERKVDRLLREVESLRRELRQTRDR